MHVTDTLTEAPVEVVDVVEVKPKRRGRPKKTDETRVVKENDGRRGPRATPLEKMREKVQADLASAEQLKVRLGNEIENAQMFVAAAEAKVTKLQDDLALVQARMDHLASDPLLNFA